MKKCIEDMIEVAGGLKTFDCLAGLFGGEAKVDKRDPRNVLIVFPEEDYGASVVAFRSACGILGNVVFKNGGIAKILDDRTYTNISVTDEIVEALSRAEMLKEDVALGTARTLVGKVVRDFLA